MRFLLPVSSSPLPLSPGVAGTFFAVGCVLSVAVGVEPLIVGGGLLASGLLVWCFGSPLGGLTLTLSASALFIRSTEDITLGEVACVALFGTAVAGWTARRITARQPLAETETDRLLAWFLALCLFSLIPALLYGNDLLKWLRELVPFLLLLAYFPVALSLRRVSEIRVLCLAYAVLCISVGVVNLYEYVQNITDTRFLWELLAGRRSSGEPLYFSTLVGVVLLTLCRRPSGWKLWAGLALTGFCVAVLAVTFSRGYWVASVLALAVAFVWMTPTMRWRVIRTGTLIIAVMAAGVLLFMDRLMYDIFEALGDRAGTLFIGTLDLSVKNRLAESAAVTDLIAANPLWGYGLGVFYHYRPLIPYDIPTWYIHNAYLYLWLKIGLAGLVVFLLWYGRIVVHSYRVYRFTTDPFLKPLALAIHAVLIAMIPLSFTSPQFIQKDSLLFVAFGAAIVERLYRTGGRLPSSET